MFLTFSESLEFRSASLALTFVKKLSSITSSSKQPPEGVKWRRIARICLG